MYDTIKGSLLFTHADSKHIDNLLKQMQSSTFNYTTNTKTYSGNLQNIKLHINQNRLRFDGSLSKFLHGNSVRALDLNTTKQAIEKFSDLTHLPMHQAQIHRLDFAQNLNVTYPAISYYPLFGESKHLTRLDQGKGLYYRNTRRELVFYDKGRDLIVLKEQVAPDIATQKLLRFEVRLKGHKNICTYFKVPDLTMERLYDLEFYKQVVIAWGNEYDKIDKYNDMPLFSDEAYRSPSLLMNQFILKGISAYGGRERVMNMLKQARKRGVYGNRYQYYAIKKKFMDLNNIGDLSIKNELIAEINYKVTAFLSYSF